MYQMLGDYAPNGRPEQRAGFMPGALGDAGFDILAPSMPIFQRFSGLKPEHAEMLQRMERGEVVGDLVQISQQIGLALSEIARGVSSGMTAFPVRENLEAEAKVLVPMDTPVRNLLPRTVGSGRSSAWKQLSSFGGGWGSATDQPGSTTNIRMFFSETITGSQAPVEHTEVYVDKSATYKLMGTYGSITGFAIASGNNYQPQLSMAKTNSLRNLMLNEEYALIAGDSTSVLAPWGDGTNALAFDGLLNLITVANGTPSAQVQTSVGPLTMSHIDNQLTRIWRQGGQSPWILMNAQEVLSLTHRAEANGSIIRIMGTTTGDVVLGVAVGSYKHPITAEQVPITASRFLPAGTIIFGSKYLPDGSPAADVQVLPQLQLPELAPTDNIQGYVVQELAPTVSAPQIYPWLVSLYECLRLKAATVWAKSSGITAV